MATSNSAAAAQVHSHSQDQQKKSGSDHKGGTEFNSKRRMSADSKRVSIDSYVVVGRRRSSGVVGSRRRLSQSHVNTNSKNDLKFEPTYRMEPKVRFCSERAENIIRQVLGRRLESAAYPDDGAETGQLTCSIADEIRAEVRELNYERYSIVVVVSIGQRIGGTIYCASRCLWDPRFDVFASASICTTQLYGFATLYALYVE